MMEGQGGADVIDNTPNISDVLAVIEEDEAATSRMGPPIQQSSNTPYIRIIEQPAPKETRFRYKCEGRSAGSIPGVSSTPDNKTHPRIQIMNFRGKGVIVVSCVTKNAPYRVHPHNLVGKDCNRGICIVEIEGSSDDVSVSFPNLGIQCVKRKDIEEELKKREEIRVDPFRMGFTHVGQPGNIDLNTVRLCFQAFIQDPVRNKLVPLQPVVSEPVHDKKAVQELTICKLSQCSGSAGGGTDIILLCEKVVKEDIAVRFFEEKNGQLFWEGYADFTPQQVHKQFAISFKTPKYATLQIEHPVQVSIELRRPSDGAASDARQFTIYPIESEPDRWGKKRKKPNPLFEETYNQSPEVEPYRGMRSNVSLIIKREPVENVSLAPGLYAGGSVSGAGVASIYSRSPSPNYPVGSPIAVAQQQSIPQLPHHISTMRQMPSPYHRTTITPPTPSYQQPTYRIGGGYGDFNLAGPSTATYTDLDTQLTQVAQSCIPDPVEINTEELRRMAIEDATSVTDTYIPSDLSI